MNRTTGISQGPCELARIRQAIGSLGMASRLLAARIRPGVRMCFGDSYP